MYLTINTISVFCCFVIAALFLFKDKSSYWQLLIAYLLITCLIEIAGIHIRKIWHRPNYPVYNALTLIDGFVISTFFYYLYTSYVNIKRWIRAWLILFIGIFIGEMVSGQFGKFVYITTSVMSVAFVLAALYYYYLMLKDEKARQLWQDASFWWVNGALFYYFGSTACNLFFDYLAQVPTQVFSLSVRYIVFSILNIILYSCWSYSFLCRYRQRKSSF